MASKELISLRIDQDVIEWFKAQGLLPSFRSVELGVFAVHPSRQYLTPKVRVLIDFLVDAFRM